MKEVFELVKNTEELVVLKVNADDNLTIAMNPYISSNYDYITVTKGEEHILTIIYKDGTTFSFHWGISGHTLISDSLKVLKNKVTEFIKFKCNILLGLNTNKLDNVRVFYNHNFNSWQVTVDGMKNGRIISDYIRSTNAHSLEDIKKCAESLVPTISNWTHKIAQTGIDVWYATF